MKYALVLIIAAFLAAIGCEDIPENTPTYGSTHIVADETLFPLVDALEKAYEHTYPKASVEVTYLPEAEAFKLFFDSLVVIVSARKLKGQEEAYLRNKKFNPRTAILANDAIALLLNPNNRDTNLTCEQALQLFNGQITEWKQINNANKTGSISLVFDNQASSTLGYVMEKTEKQSPPANSYALKTTEAVVDYVAQHPEAVGIVGYSWLSDYDDPKHRELRSKIKITGLSPCDDGQTKSFYKPYSMSVQEKFYPFSRQIFAINRETSNGTGTGFTAFMAGEIGQRIISKAGILPAYKVEHKIELKSEPFKVKK